MSRQSVASDRARRDWLAIAQTRSSRRRPIRPQKQELQYVTSTGLLGAEDEEWSRDCNGLAEKNASDTYSVAQSGHRVYACPVAKSSRLTAHELVSGRWREQVESQALPCPAPSAEGG